MKVLITGSTGLLGSTITPYLASNFQVITHGNTSASADINCDFSIQEQALDVLNQIQPDVIINLVALTDVDKCELEPHLAYSINVKTCENIAKWSRANSNTHVISISTDQVYDNPNLSTEDDVVISNYYGLSKYAGELAFSGTNTTILRTNLFGKSHNSSRSSLTDWLFNSFINSRKITLFNDVYISPLSMTTISELLSTVIKERTVGIYNMGSSSAMSKKEFALYFAKQLNIEHVDYVSASVNDSNLIARRPMNMVMDSSKFAANFKTDLPTLENEINKVLSEYDI